MSLDLGAIVARATIEDGPFQVQYTRLVRQLGDLGRKATASAAGTERLDESLTQAAAASNAAATGLGRAERALSGAGLSASEATAATSAYRSVLTEAGAASSRLTQATLRQNAAQARLEELQVSGKASARQLASAQATLIAAADRTALAEERAGKAAGFQSQAWQSAGRRMVVTGGLIAAGFVYAAKEAANFDAKMALVRTLAKAGPDDMAKLRDAALHVGQAYGYSASQVADAEAELVKAGLNTKQIIGGALTGALTLAAAGQMDVAQATEIATVAMTQFHLQANQTSHVADLLAAGADKALGSVADLGEALRYGGLASAQAGMSIENTVGTLAELAQAGQIGSTAGSQLAMMLQNLQKPSAQAAALMDKYGLSLYNADGTTKSYTQIAGELHDVLGSLPNVEQKTALATIFTSRARRAATVLTRDGAAANAEWTKSVNDQGFAALQASGKLDSLSGDLIKLKAALQTAFIGAGEGSQGPLRTMLRDLTSVVEEWDKLPQPVRTAAEALMAISGGVLLVGGGMLLLLPRIVKTREAMAELSISGSRVASVLGKGGVLVAAIYAATEAVGSIDNAMHHTSINADAMTSSLQTLARTGRVTGEITRAFGSDLSNLKSTVDLSAHGVSVFGLTFHNLGDTFTHSGGDFKDARDRIASVDQALSDLVTSGHADEARRAYGQITDAARQQGVSMDKLASRFPQYSGAVRASGESAANAANGVDKYGNAVGAAAKQTKSATDAAKAYADRLHSLADPLFAMNSAVTDLRSKQDALNTAIRKHGADSRAARQAQLDLASSALDVAAASKDLTASVEDGSTSLSQARQTLRSWVSAGLITQKQADAVAQSFGGLIDKAKGVSRELTAAGKGARAAGRGIGVDFGQGIVDGLDSKNGEVRTKAKLLASQLEKYARLATESHSPSRVAMRIGQDFGTGLALGLDASQPAAAKSARDLVQKALDAAKQELSSTRSSASSLASGIADTVIGAGALSNFQLGPNSTAADLVTFEKNKAAQAMRLLILARRLKRHGYDPDVVSQVEQMGAAGLPYARTLLDASQAQVHQLNMADRSLHSFGRQAGQFARQDVYGPKIDRISRQIDQLHQDLQHLKHVGSDVGTALNGVAAHAAHKAHAKGNR